MIITIDSNIVHTSTTTPTICLRTLFLLPSDHDNHKNKGRRIQRQSQMIRNDNKCFVSLLFVVLFFCCHCCWYELRPTIVGAVVMANDDMKKLSSSSRHEQRQRKRQQQQWNMMREGTNPKHSFYGLFLLDSNVDNNADDSLSLKSSSSSQQRQLQQQRRQLQQQEQLPVRKNHNKNRMLKKKKKRGGGGEDDEGKLCVIRDTVVGSDTAVESPFFHGSGTTQKSGGDYRRQRRILASNGNTGRRYIQASDEEDVLMLDGDEYPYCDEVPNNNNDSDDVATSSPTTTESDENDNDSSFVDCDAISSGQGHIYDYYYEEYLVDMILATTANDVVRPVLKQMESYWQSMVATTMSGCRVGLEDSADTPLSPSVLQDTDTVIRNVKFNVRGSNSTTETGITNDTGMYDIVYCSR